MNCQNCKNPIINNTRVCEWCGVTLINQADEKKIVIGNSMAVNDFEFITLYIKFDGSWGAMGSVKIEIDDLKVGSGSHNKGFEIHCKTKNKRPNICLYSPFKSKINLPEDVMFELGSTYLIKLKTSYWSLGGFSSIPEKVIKINSL